MAIDPLYYPPANTTAQRFDLTHPGSKYPSVEKIVWHSTETGGWPAYKSGPVAPHMTASPDYDAKKVDWRAHFPANVNSRALQNLAGGVQTNLDGAFQIELVGTCDPAQHKSFPKRLYMPDAPDWYLNELAAFAAWAHENWGVPLQAPGFQAYPASAGAKKPDGPSNTVRMSGATWNAFRGHCGHQHVPENVHGDPGSLDMAAVMSRATSIISSGGVPPVDTEEDDMQWSDKIKLTATDAKYWGGDYKEGDEVSVGLMIRYPTLVRKVELEAAKANAVLVAKLDALTQAVSAIAASSSTEVAKAFDNGIARLDEELSQLEISVKTHSE
jgi:hypothetical protein